MFGSRRRGTVIAEGLKIVGTVTAECLVEVNGQIEGELHCTSLIISRKAHVAAAVQAGRNDFLRPIATRGAATLTLRDSMSGSVPLSLSGHC
jgi:hypothetical protein